MIHDSEKPITILYADDDPEDRMLVQDAWQESRLRNELHFVEDGEELMEYLQRRGKFANLAGSPLPGLVLLDLNMPRLGGKDVLARIKSDPGMKIIPVVAFTTSGREEDILQCFSAGVNSYVQKPTDFDRFQTVLRHVEQYWLTISSLPPRLL